MNDLELLTQLRADVPEPTTDVLMDARVQLLDRMAPPVAAPPRRRRVGRGLAIVAGLAAAVAAAAVTANVVTVHHKPVGGATAEAVALLNQAASAAARTVDPPLQPGQYRYVRTHAWYGDENGDNGGYYLSEQLIEEWYSTNGTEDIRTTSPIATKFFDPAYERQLRASQPDQFVRTVSWTGHGLSADPNPEWIAGLPLNDSKTLLAKIDENEDHSDSAEQRYEYEFSWIADFLRSGLVDGQVRAAIYRAAATIPGVYVVDKTANLDGRTGVAIGRNTTDGALRREFIFDAPGGQYIGEREVMIAPNCVTSTDKSHHVQMVCVRAPIGTPLSSSAVTMKVVTGKPAR
jgi:RNA polymerase sigma-70 factor (ECF subfamily)